MNLAGEEDGKHATMYSEVLCRLDVRYWQ